MKYPNLISADQLYSGEDPQTGLVMHCWPGAGLRDGRWVAARPVGYPSILRRFRLAWGVFTGRYDALKWTEQ